MTLSQRLTYALETAVGPTALFFNATRAAINQAKDSPTEWGQGGIGYGRRLGDAYAERTLTTILQHGGALALHEDDRYFVSGQHGFRNRLKYALSSSFLTRHDDGSRHIAISGIGGMAAEDFIARTWQPRSTASAGDAAVAFGVGMAVRTGFNVAREFLPRRLGRMLQ